MANSDRLVDERDQTTLAVAALFAALVRALHGLDATLPSRMQMEMENVYNELKSWSGDTSGAEQVLLATSRILKSTQASLGFLSASRE